MSQWTNISGPAFWDLHVASSPHIYSMGEGSVSWEGSEATYSNVGANEFIASGMALTPKGDLAVALATALNQNGVLNFRVRMSSDFAFQEAHDSGTAGFFTRQGGHVFGGAHVADFFPESLATTANSGFGPGYGELVFEPAYTGFSVDVGEGDDRPGLFLGAAIPAGNEAINEFFSCRLISIETDISLVVDSSDFWTNRNLTRELPL